MGFKEVMRTTFFHENGTWVTIHGLADKENPAVIDSGVFAWLIEVPVYF